MKKSDCYGCDERHQGCHAECEKYKKFREAIDKRKEAEKQERMITADIAKSMRKKKYV